MHSKRIPIITTRATAATGIIIDAGIRLLPVLLMLSACGLFAFKGKP
jgi:hypothetical protein